MASVLSSKRWSHCCVALARHTFSVRALIWISRRCQLGVTHVRYSISLLAGPAGAGQSCKAANQVTIATTMIGLCEGLLFAHASGLDLDAYLTAIRGGAAGSRSLELYAPRLRKGDLAPGFLVKHFIKDLRIALDECNRMRLALPGLALAQQLYTALAAQGDEELGTQALVRVLERLNNVKLPVTSA